jgi:hypothetical protein
MKVSQIVALAFLAVIIGGLAFGFVRRGARLKRHDNPDNWPAHTGGSGGDGASPSP